MNMNAGDAQQRSRLAKAKKAAQRREENWGLPDTTKKATAISRPIYLECYADKLVILPEKGENHVPLVIPVDEGVNAQMEVLLTTTWQIMDRWGLAIFNGYWKPVLTVAVKPGADARFAELQQALQGSGLEVERKLR